MQAAANSDTEQPWESNVSAWVDGEGEIRTEDLDTPYGRQVWDTYHLIGDVLRSDDLAIKPSDLFYARVSKAIDDEPPIVAPVQRKHPHLRVGLSGLAVAAAVASVAWIAMPYFSGSGSQLPAGSVLVASSGGDEAVFVDYVDAHRQLVGVNPIRQVSFEAGVHK